MISFPYFLLLTHSYQLFYPKRINHQLSDTFEQKKPTASANFPYNTKDLISLNDTFIDGILTGKNVTIAVLDTGLYAQHEVFSATNILAFYDVIEKVEKSPTDVQWHGTYVSSLIVGSSSSFQGIAPGVNLIGIRIFVLDEGENSEPVSSISYVKEGIDWILENKEKYNIKIVSMSFGLDRNSDIISIRVLNSITESLIDAGIVVVAAVGNDGTQGEEGYNTVNSPADAKSVIGVGGVTAIGMMYPASGKGPSSEGYIKPDLCAQAIDILGATSDFEGVHNDYNSYRGTSAATPLVSGLAALMIEKNRSLNPLKIKSILSLTSVKTTHVRTLKDNIQGWGVIQGYAALEALDKYVNFTHNQSVSFYLGDDENQRKVWCRRISLTGGMYYFFDLSWLGQQEAELYIFDTEPNQYGEPQLIASTINQWDLLRRCGLFVPETKDYFIVVKIIYGTGEGWFLLSAIFDYRMLIVFLISALMVLGVIYIVKDYKSRN